MSKKKVRLPEIPQDLDLEDYVAAFLQSAGFVVEKSIVEREVEEILELDIIATEYDRKSLHSFFVEVKSGGWGFPDIFKVLGWMNYLKFDNSYFVVTKEKESIDFIKKRISGFGISLVQIETFDNTEQLEESFCGGSGQEIDPYDLINWRFSYWTERKLLRYLKAKKKKDHKSKCYTSLDEYHHGVNSKIFFSRNIIDRVNQLYDLYKKYPHLSARTGCHMNGDDFDGDHKEVPSSVFKETFYECKMNPVQVACYIEHRSRLSILKCVTDYLLYKNVGEMDRTEDKVKFFGTKISKLDFLPDSFRDGLKDIANDKYFYCYPRFWQWFMWYFGGFILLDYKEEEYKLLESKTGVPVEHIDEAFSAYERLFPFSGGWFANLGQESKMKVLKMFPMPFRGVGTNVRRLNYSENKKFDGLELSGKYTLDDMLKWNSLTVDLLSA